MLLKEREGYDLVVSDSLGTPNGFAFVKEAPTTNTSGNYGIIRQGKRVGYAALNFGLKRKEVGFDIAITEPGDNLGATALRGLANTLDERGFSLVTAGIMPSSRGYWEHLAERGDVVPIDTSDPTTGYRVVPAATSEPEIK